MTLETVKQSSMDCILPFVSWWPVFTWPWTTAEVRTEFSFWVLDCLLSNLKGLVAMAALCPSLTESLSPLGVLEAHSWVPTSCAPGGSAVWREGLVEKCSE